ncbi:MAG: tRNA guanosine(34) transglycosylase Tgt [Candidatus Falkowbacteria bacterium]
MFKILKKYGKSQARLGVLKTAHGEIKTPFFMPVATQASVKQVATEEMRRLSAQILLSNTYHLMLRPGEKLVKKAGGLHKFMDWDRPILTDSGGFQVFSLAGTKKRSGENLVKLTADGVRFKSYVDGREYYLTPEKSLKIQADLGVDIAVCLDECVALPAERKYIEQSVELTTAWARKTKKYHDKLKGEKPLLHSVIQGGLDKALRLKSLSDLARIGFDGYNIGGLSVGESAAEMYAVLDYLVPEIPKDKPRYLMGVGYPENIVEAVRRGVDMFDCVIPTREGRHGRIFSWRKKRGISNIPALPGRQCPISNNFYKTDNITNSKFAEDFTPINAESKLPELRNLSKAYLHYLFKIREPLGQRLATLNNLEFYLDMMEKIRYSIKSGLL